MYALFYSPSLWGMFGTPSPLPRCLHDPIGHLLIRGPMIPLSGGGGRDLIPAFPKP